MNYFFCQELVFFSLFGKFAPRSVPNISSFLVLLFKGQRYFGGLAVGSCHPPSTSAPADFTLLPAWHPAVIWEEQAPIHCYTDLENSDAQLSQSLFANVLAPLAPHLAFESKHSVPSCFGFGSLGVRAGKHSLAPQNSCPLQLQQAKHRERRRQKGRGVPGMKYLAAKPLCFSVKQKIFHFFCLTVCAFSICQALWRAALNMLPGASFDGQSFSLYAIRKAQISVSSCKSNLPKGLMNQTIMM